MVVFISSVVQRLEALDVLSIWIGLAANIAQSLPGKVAFQEKGTGVIRFSLWTTFGPPAWSFRSAVRGVDSYC